MQDMCYKYISCFFDVLFWQTQFIVHIDLKGFE